MKLPVSALVPRGMIQFGCCAGLLALPAAALAQPAPRLTGISKEYLERGKKLEITLNGENLSGLKDFIVTGDSGVKVSRTQSSGPGVSVESSKGGLTSIATPNDKSVAVTFDLGDNSSLNDREVRVVNDYGISNPINFKVSYLPELDVSGDIGSIEKAQAIAGTSIVSGVLRGQGQSDFFKFNAKSGAHHIFNLYAYRIGSQLDSSAAILDKSGKELARNEDAAGLDSIIDFVPPRDGEYFLQIRDFRYRGGGEYRYRLVAGLTSPYIENIFPFGGQRGKMVEVELKGQNLDGNNKLLLNLDANAPLGRQDIRTAAGAGRLSNPVQFEVSDLPQFLEKEPNTALDQADPVSVPGSINGRISKEKDYDAYKFQAGANQFFVFELFASRFGSSLDALMTLTDDRGKVLLRSDDSSGSDSRFERNFTQAGDYILIVEDLLGRGGDNFGYRINVSTPKPDYSVVLTSDAPRLRRDGKLPIRVELNRANGFNETVRVEFADLPAGVFCEPVLFPPNNAGSAFVILNAAPNAVRGTTPLQLVGKSMLSGKDVLREAQVSGARAAFLTVLEAAPFSVQPSTLLGMVEQNQAVNIDIAVERRNGYAGEIKIFPDGPSVGRFDFQPLVLAPGQSAGALTLRAKQDAEAAVRPIFLRAEGVASGHAVSEFSAMVPISSTAVPFLLTTTMKRLVLTALPPGSGSAAGEGVFGIKADRRGGFNGEINLVLEGVPEGVAVSGNKIPAGALEASIKLVASEKAAVGKEVQIKITGNGVHNDRNYRHQPAALALNINAPEGAPAASTAPAKVANNP